MNRCEEGQTASQGVVDESATPDLSGIAVHWYDESAAEALAAGWPVDPRFELLIVNNGSESELVAAGARVIEPEHNLGFAGAVNLGSREARGDIVLILNTDITVEPGALEKLLDGFRRHPEAAGLAPRLLDENGASQHRWQLRPLPSVWTLLLQCLMIPTGAGSDIEPEAGDVVEQPAAAALAMRRRVLEEAGGFDESFYPAWFEDVELAARLRDGGHLLIYWPHSVLSHSLGTSIRRLGYGRFLWIYYANLERYVRKRHGTPWAAVVRLLLVPACLLRVVLLPIRKPRRAPDRRRALVGLIHLMQGALSGWRHPRSYSLANPGTDPAGT